MHGALLSSIGKRGEGAPRLSGKPFNQPTKLARDPNSGALFITDGYGNAKVHKYTAEGDYVMSWGEFGVGPGQFNLPHSVCTAPADCTSTANAPSSGSCRRTST